MEELFREDEAGRVIIEVTAPRYDDLFNVLDRAPFRRRDLSADLEEFLDEYNQWVPVEQSVVLELQITEDGPDPEREDEVVSGIRAYYGYRVHLAEDRRRRQLRRVAGFVGLSFVLLSGTLFLTPLLDSERVLPAFVLNGLTVGAWVFLWEALTALFIRRLDEQEAVARQRRFMDAEIVFTFP